MAFTLSLSHLNLSCKITEKRKNRLQNSPCQFRFLHISFKYLYSSSAVSRRKVEINKIFFKQRHPISICLAGLGKDGTLGNKIQHHLSSFAQAYTGNSVHFLQQGNRPYSTPSNTLSNLTNICRDCVLIPMQKSYQFQEKTSTKDFSPDVVHDKADKESQVSYSIVWSL